MGSLFGAQTTYPTRGQIQTVGSTGMYRGGGGGPGPGGGGGFNVGGLLGRRAGQLLQRGSLENQALEFQLSEARRAASRARAPRLETWDSQTGLENFSRRNQMRQMGAQTRMLEAQARAQTQGPPMRQAPMQGATSAGWMPDPNVMTGAQRQAFLPGGSEFTAMPTSSDMFSMQRAGAAGQSAGELDAIRALSGAQMAGFAPGGGAGNWGWYGPQSPMGRAQRQTGIDDQIELERKRRQYGLAAEYGGGYGAQ